MSYHQSAAIRDSALLPVQPNRIIIHFKFIPSSFNCACDIDYDDISISSSVSHVIVPHSNIQKEQSSKRICKATKIKQTSKVSVVMHKDLMDSISSDLEDQIQPSGIIGNHSEGLKFDLTTKKF